MGTMVSGTLVSNFGNPGVKQETVASAVLIPSPFTGDSRHLSPIRELLSVLFAKWSPRGLMVVALDVIIVRLVVYRHESAKRSTADATVSSNFVFCFSDPAKEILDRV